MLTPQGLAPSGTVTAPGISQSNPRVNGKDLGLCIYYSFVNICAPSLAQISLMCPLYNYETLIYVLIFDRIRRISA